jgi:ribonuclease D
VVTEQQKRRETLLKDWRKNEAQRLKVDVSVVLPQRLIDKLTEAAPSTAEELAATPGLRRWRVQAFGPALLQVLRTAS